MKQKEGDSHNDVSPPWHLVAQISCDKDTPDQKGTHKMGTALSLSNYDQIGDEDRADGRKIN